MNSHDPTLHICFVRRPLAAEMTYCAVKMHVQIFQISKNIQKNKPEAKYWQNVLLRHLAPLTLEIEKHRCLKGQHCSSSTMKGESWSDKCVCSLAVPTNKNLSESYLLWMDAPRALTQTVHRPVALIPPPSLIELSESEYCSPLVKLKSYGVCLADLGSEGSVNMCLLFVYIWWRAEEKVGEENGEGVEDTSAGPIFCRDSWNEVKNPPGGARCWRVMKNRCLFPLCFADLYTEGSALSCSGSSSLSFLCSSMFSFCLSSLTPHYSPLPPRLMQQPALLLLFLPPLCFPPQMTTLQ